MDALCSRPVAAPTVRAVTEQELAGALRPPTQEEFLAHWLALSEMERDVGIEAVGVDLEVERAQTDRQLEVWKILAPHMKAGARSWRELHDALSPQEHDQIEDLLADL
jgi:hypothetical protein